MYSQIQLRTCLNGEEKRVFIASSNDFRLNSFKIIKIASIQCSIEFLYYLSRKECLGMFK
jgi:hypothetical protein